MDPLSEDDDSLRFSATATGKRSSMAYPVPPSEICMTIQPGKMIPDASVQVIDGEVRKCRTSELFAARKVVMFGVPGAFTPTCSNKHLPGYVNHLADFRERDITVMCLAVNDAHVMQAWAASLQVPAELLMIADGNAAFTQSMGLELDGTAFGMGVRVKRFALFAEDGVVRLLQIEAPGEFRVSTAEAILTAIDH
jgi:peroxiredoxin